MQRQRDLEWRIRDGHIPRGRNRSKGGYSVGNNGERIHFHLFQGVSFRFGWDSDGTTVICHRSTSLSTPIQKCIQSSSRFSEIPISVPNASGDHARALPSLKKSILQLSVGYRLSAH